MGIAQSTSKTLGDAAYRRIRADILSGELKPSEKLKFSAMVSRYAFGLSPLREALTRLSSDHLVLFEGQRGFTVAPTSREELFDVSRMRKLVDGEATVLSIANGDIEWEASIVAAFFRLQRAEERRHVDTTAWAQEWEDCNFAFHTAVTSQCRSIWLQRFQEMLYAQHKRYRVLSLHHPVAYRDLNAEHKAIMDACLNRDVALARRLTDAHIDNTANFVATLLPEKGVVDPAALVRSRKRSATERRAEK